MSTVIIGSQEWINQWIQFFTRQAMKFAEREDEYSQQQCYVALLRRELWKDAKPWDTNPLNVMTQLL